MKPNSIFAICAATALAFTACQNAEEPMVNEPIDQSGAITRAAGSIDDFYRFAYIEVNDVNPLNALEYKLSNGKPFFTHVILFASNIRGDANGNVHNYNNPNNEAILSNPAKYIQPLRDAGIKVIMGNLGDHTGAGFSNLTAAQIETYTDDLVAYEDIVDGYDFDDEWAEYGTRGYPAANSTSFSNLIIRLNEKTDNMITVFDWDLARNINSTAAACVDYATYGALNGYSTNPSFPIPLSRYGAYFCNLSQAPAAALVKLRVNNAVNAGAGGVTFFNLPMQPTMVSRFNAAAEVFGETCTHTGTTYAKDYGN